MGLIADIVMDRIRTGREEENAAKYGNLMQSYQQPGNPDAMVGPWQQGDPMLQQGIQQRQGGYMQPSGLLGASLPSEFYAKAAAIPGYQALAAGAQQNAGAMERQQNQQIWDSQNMTMAQKVSADAAQQNELYRRDREKYEYATPSAYQQAQIGQGQQQIGISAGNLGVAQARLGLEQQQMQNTANMQQLKRMYPALGLEGQGAIDYRNTRAGLDDAAAISADVVDYLGKVGVGEKAIDRGTVNAMQAAYQLKVVPAMAKMVGTGALQKGDMDFIESVMGEPGAWKSLDSNQQKKVSSIMRTIEDERARQYSYAGERPPPTQSGSSAWARSDSTPSAPPAKFRKEWHPNLGGQ